MKTTEVRQGTPIVYSINGQEYSGVALGSVSCGYNHARVAAGHHLNLIYLNEQGSPIKIFGAPLLTEATTEDHIEEQFELEKHYHASQELAETALENRVVTIGWKPLNICAPVAAASDADTVGAGSLGDGPSAQAFDMLKEHASELADELQKAKTTIDDRDNRIAELEKQLEDEKAAHTRAVEAAANAAGRGNNEQENQS